VKAIGSTVIVSSGRTNLEIGAELQPAHGGMAPAKVFTELGVTSRRDLLRTPAA
jgi:hypothetical protein